MVRPATGYPTIMSKADVVLKLDAKETFWTVYDDGRIGAQVHLVKGRYGNYIRTSADGIEADNLDGIPRF